MHGSIFIVILAVACGIESATEGGSGSPFDANCSSSSSSGSNTTTASASTTTEPSVENEDLTALSGKYSWTTEKIAMKCSDGSVGVLDPIAQNVLITVLRKMESDFLRVK